MSTHATQPFTTKGGILQARLFGRVKHRDRVRSWPHNPRPSPHVVARVIVLATSSSTARTAVVQTTGTDEARSSSRAVATIKVVSHNLHYKKRTSGENTQKGRSTTAVAARVGWALSVLVGSAADETLAQRRENSGRGTFDRGDLKEVADSTSY